MENKKGTQYQSNAKRRQKLDALGRPMKAPSFGITSTRKGYIVSEFVANQIIQKDASLAQALTFVEKPVYKDGKKVMVKGKPKMRKVYKPVPFKFAVSVRNAVHQWALDKFAKDEERKVMSKANKAHRELSSRFKRVKEDKYRRNGTVKEHVTITDHARMIRELQAAQPPLVLIGLEMIRQGVIV